MRSPRILVLATIIAALVMSAVTDKLSAAQSSYICPVTKTPAPRFVPPPDPTRTINPYMVPVEPSFRDDVFDWGTPALEIRLDPEQKEPSLVASVWWACSRFSIYGISVKDPQYRTREGLGVGSTLGELRRYFKLDGPFEEAEDGTLAAITPGVTFALEHSEAPTDKTKVKAVWVYPDEETIQKRGCP